MPCFLVLWLLKLPLRLTLLLPSTVGALLRRISQRPSFTGSSMRITSAPKEASHFVAPAPASWPVKSQMRKEDRASGIDQVREGVFSVMLRDGDRIYSRRRFSGPARRGQGHGIRTHSHRDRRKGRHHHVQPAGEAERHERADARGNPGTDRHLERRRSYRRDRARRRGARILLRRRSRRLCRPGARQSKRHGSIVPHRSTAHALDGRAAAAASRRS